MAAVCLRQNSDEIIEDSCAVDWAICHLIVTETQILSQYNKLFLNAQ